MKRILTTLSLSLFFISVFAQSPSDVSNSKSWTWFGIDYSHCYFLTKMDFPDAYDLKEKLQAWNDLVLLEKEKYIYKTLTSKKVDFSTDMIKAVNDQVDVTERLDNDGFKSTHLDPADIQGIVNGYDIPQHLEGVGLILIAESYSKPNKKGAYFVTFFDIETGEVLITERMLGKAQGFGLRNYWAYSYYKVLQQVGKKYK
jgi:hypothetical protein